MSPIESYLIKLADMIDPAPVAVAGGGGVYMPPAGPILDAAGMGLQCRHVTGPGQGDIGRGACGLTTAAVLAGVTYDAALTLDPRPRPLGPGRGLWAREMIELLTAATGRPWRVGMKKRAPLRSFKPPAKLGAAIMRAGKVSHWVAFEVIKAAGRGPKLAIFDPAAVAGPLDARAYGRAWQVGKFVLPK